MDSGRGVKKAYGPRIPEDTVNARGSYRWMGFDNEPLSDGRGKFPRASGSILNIALTSTSAKAVAGALDMLRARFPLDPYQKAALDRRLHAIIANGLVPESPDLTDAIARYLHASARERAEAVSPFIPALLAFLEMDLATIGACSYFTLLIIAEEKPEDLCPYADQLVGKLIDSRYAVRTLVSRIIAKLASKCPDALVPAHDVLRDLARGSDEGPLRTEAAKALQALEGRNLAAMPGVTRSSSKVTRSAPRPPRVRRWIFSIRARLLNMVRLLIKRGGESKEMTRAADDLREIARWIEARFPLPGDTPPDKGVMAFHEGQGFRFPRRMSPDGFGPGPAGPLEANGPRVVAKKRTSQDRPAAEWLTEEDDTAQLKKMMEEYGRDFSAVASHALDDMGMTHLKRGWLTRKRGDPVDVQELLRHLKKGDLEQKSKKPVTAPAPPRQSTSVPHSSEQLLLGEIRQSIDDSLRMTRLPDYSVTESYLKFAKGKASINFDSLSCDNLITKYNTPDTRGAKKVKKIRYLEHRHGVKYWS